jgi:phage baseplate assembly protein W
MKNIYYKIPFDFEAVMSENTTILTCDIAESIAQNLMLLITTRKGENRFNPNYGNLVWDLEFDNGITTVKWEELFRQSLVDQIALYEPRIIFPKIDVKIEYVEHSYDTKEFVELRKKAKININAVLKDVGENFSFSTSLYLSPMAID